MSLARQLLIVLVVAVLGFAGYRYGLPLIRTGEAAKPDVASRPQARVVALPVAFKPEVIRFEAVGTARALRSVTLYPASSGEVVEVNIEAGARVEEGQVLLRLDHRAERLAQRLAAVKVKTAEQLLARYDKTAGTGAVPENTIETARNALEEARIALAQANVALADRQVTAPFAGIVGLTDVEVGDRIAPEQPIVTLDDRGALLIDFAIPEALITRIGVGERVEIATWADRDLPLAGDIVDIASRIDPATRSFRARARVADGIEDLRPGMSFAVRQTLEGARYPAVPEIAVQWGGDGAFLWVLRESKGRRVPLIIVQRQGGEVLVDAQIAAGELVVIEGVQKMREGRETAYDLAAPPGQDG